MALQKFIRQSFETLWEWLERYIDGLTQAELEYRPDRQYHSIGFIVWHYGRALDLWVQTLARQRAQSYVTEWAARSGMAPEPMDVGVGYSAADLAAWRCPDKALLVAYAAAARGNLLAFLAQQDDAALLNTPITTHWGQTITLADMFRLLLWEVNQHGGQAGYLRVCSGA